MWAKCLFLHKATKKNKKKNIYIVTSNSEDDAENEDNLDMNEEPRNLRMMMILTKRFQFFPRMMTLRMMS